MLHRSLVLIAFLIPTFSSVTASPRPLWTRDLREYGSQGARIDTVLAMEASRRIVFGSANELLVVSPREEPVDPFEVQGFVLDAKKGSLLAKRSWTSRDTYAVFGTPRGRYVVNTAGGIQLLDSELKEILTTETGPAEMASPGRRMIAVRSLAAGHRGVIFLDAETLRPAGLEFTGVPVHSIASDRVAFAGSLDDPHKTSLIVRDSRGDKRVFESTCREIAARFISDTMIALVGCSRLEVVSLDGKRLFSAKSDGGDVASVACDGSRFVIVEQDGPVERAETIKVFDVRKKQVVARLDASDSTVEDAGLAGVGLAPDGSLLGVVRGDLVQVFELPVPLRNK